MSQWERFTDTFFNRAVIIQYLPDIYHGIWITLELSILIVIFGILLGTCLAVLRVYKILPLSFFIVVFADVFRALPPLVLILIAFLVFQMLGFICQAFSCFFLCNISSGGIFRGDHLGWFDICRQWSVESSAIDGA